MTTLHDAVEELNRRWFLLWANVRYNIGYKVDCLCYYDKGNAKTSFIVLHDGGDWGEFNGIARADSGWVMIPGCPIHDGENYHKGE